MESGKWRIENEGKKIITIFISFILNSQFSILHFLLGCLIFFGLLSPAQAWDRHNLVTCYSLTDQSWLDRYSDLKVTPYTYRDDSLSSQFRIMYTNLTQDTPPPGEFRYYTLRNLQKPGFIGTPIGSQTSARQILIDFSDEPDWNMDVGLQLAAAQVLMAGSRGYRHMYYPIWDWHLPFLFVPQGAAPERAEHFYRMARQSFMQKDAYWGFRFLARALHYVQDLGQPYHTTQTSWKFITWSSPIGGTTQATKNYHFAYESYAAYRLECEANGLMSPDYSLALTKSRPLTIENINSSLIRLAKMSNKLTPNTFQASVDFFGSRLRSAQEVPITQADVERINKIPERQVFDEQVRKAFDNTGAATKGFIEYVRRNLKDVLP